MEKITINPSQIRGLGNTITSKAATDFTKQYSTLTQTTDTVHGTTQKVFQQDSSILLRDGATTNDHNDIWSNMTPFTRTSDGTTVYYQNTGSSAFQDWLSSRVNINNKEVAIELELTSCTFIRFQLGRYLTGQSTTYEGREFTTTGIVRWEIRENGTFIYLNNTLVQSDTTETNLEQISLGLYCATNKTLNAKYKDLRIYYL